jgi:hypothetical protein
MNWSLFVLIRTHLVACHCEERNDEAIPPQEKGDCHALQARNDK